MNFTKYFPFKLRLIVIGLFGASLVANSNSTICFLTFNGGQTHLLSSENEQKVLQEWRAGAEVSLQGVNQFGLKRCFSAGPILDGVFKRIYGKSYKPNCSIPRSSLRYIKVLHYTADGKICLGEMICNKRIANDLVDIFHKLFDARYPIEKMLLIDNYHADDELSMSANNTSCFNFRKRTRMKKLSNHATGCAVDINPLYNPYVNPRGSKAFHVRPINGAPYADRKKSFRFKIDHHDLCYKLFVSHGFIWGGDWRRTKDYQHFEK